MTSSLGATGVVPTTSLCGGLSRELIVGLTCYPAASKSVGKRQTWWFWVKEPLYFVHCIYCVMHLSTQKLHETYLLACCASKTLYYI